MTPQELQQELSRGRLRPAYLLAGEEPLLRDDALAALRAAVLGDAPADFNLDRLDGSSSDASTLLDAVRSLPVLARRRLVVLREPETRRAAGRGLAEGLARALETLDDAAPAVLVVTAARPDRRVAWVRAFAERGGVVECEPPRGTRALAAFVRAEAERQGLRLGDGVAAQLAERIGPQLYALRQELTKAALLAGGDRIESEHVEASACELAEDSVWDLTDAIGEGRAGDALGVLVRLVRGGAPAPVVLGALASHVRRLLRVRAGGRVPGPPFVVRKLQSQARRYTLARLEACLAAIHEVDEVLKGRGGISPELALERLVLGLAA